QDSYAARATSHLRAHRALLTLGLRQKDRFLLGIPRRRSLSQRRGHADVWAGCGPTVLYHGRLGRRHGTPATLVAPPPVQVRGGPMHYRFALAALYVVLVATVAATLLFRLNPALITALPLPVATLATVTLAHRRG